MRRELAMAQGTDSTTSETGTTGTADTAGTSTGRAAAQQPPPGQAREAAGHLSYLPGFGNEHSSEAEPGALPIGRNSPQRAPFGLYAEQLSGTAFTEPRAHNRRSWLYRIHPSAAHPRFVRTDNGSLRGAPFEETVPDPNRLRWSPLPES